MVRAEPAAIPTRLRHTSNFIEELKKQLRFRRVRPRFDIASRAAAASTSLPFGIRHLVSPAPLLYKLGP